MLLCAHLPFLMSCLAGYTDEHNGDTHNSEQPSVGGHGGRGQWRHPSSCARYMKYGRYVRRRANLPRRVLVDSVAGRSASYAPNATTVLGDATRVRSALDQDDVLHGRKRVADRHGVLIFE